MTTMLAPLALEDVAALCFEPSFLLADPMGPLVDPDDEDEEEEEALSPSSSLEGGAPLASPPPLCLSPFQTSSPPPPSSSSSLLGTKDPGPPDPLTGPDPLSWLDAGSLLLRAKGADDGADDAFAGMDWMTEKMDLSEFDLDSLIGSCSSDDPPSSPEELLASLHCQMDQEPYGPASPEGPAPPALKCEPPPSPPPPPASPVYLEIRSDVDLLDKVSTTVTATIVQDPASGRVLLVVANKEEPGAPAPPPRAPGAPESPPPPSGDSDGDSGIDSPASSPPPPAGSSRTKPYSRPGGPPGAPLPSPPRAAPKVKVVEKKLKKMEQNKTAATRYRQKKRVEQELLSSECEELEKKNQQLEEQAQAINREINYLRDLMDEVKRRRNKT